MSRDTLCTLWYHSIDVDDREALEELRAKVENLEARLERLTLRVLYVNKGEAERPVWRPEWSPPKDVRPRCGAATSRGPCSSAVVWDRASRAPLHGRCARHAPGRDR
jgi:hypothetical protein